eukprot:Tbor_TRINITY_DN5973_c0_g2::TRINITY_DN5973_c0_g2_i1::g.18980::m.18980
MSNEAGGWESVKGFCRRRTQKIKHSTGISGFVTKDEEFDQKVSNFEKLHVTSKAIIKKLAALEVHIVGAMDVMVELGQLFRTAGTVSGSDNVLQQGKKIDAFAKYATPKISPLHSLFGQAIVELEKYSTTGDQLPPLLDDRKDKQLELDFFINKTNELKAHPPSDHTRIPRNESRIAEWKQKYDDSTAKITKFVDSCGSGLGNGVISAVTAVVSDYGKTIEEIGRFSKTILIATGNAKDDNPSSAIPKPSYNLL